MAIRYHHPPTSLLPHPPTSFLPNLRPRFHHLLFETRVSDCQRSFLFRAHFCVKRASKQRRLVLLDLALLMLAGGDDVGELCTICYTCTRAELDAAASLGTLDCCEHFFCADCIRPWLSTRSSTCPICRQQVRRLSVIGDGVEVRRCQLTCSPFCRCTPARSPRHSFLLHAMETVAHTSIPSTSLHLCGGGVAQVSATTVSRVDQHRTAGGDEYASVASSSEQPLLLSASSETDFVASDDDRGHLLPAGRREPNWGIPLNGRALQCHLAHACVYAAPGKTRPRLLHFSRAPRARMHRLRYSRATVHHPEDDPRTTRGRPLSGRPGGQTGGRAQGRVAEATPSLTATIAQVARVTYCVARVTYCVKVPRD